MANIFKITGKNCERIFFYNDFGIVRGCTIYDIIFNSYNFITGNDGDTIDISDCLVSVVLKSRKRGTMVGNEEYDYIDIDPFDNANGFYLYEDYWDCEHNDKSKAILYFDDKDITFRAYGGIRLDISLSKDIHELIGCFWKNAIKINSFKDWFLSLFSKRVKRLYTYMWDYSVNCPIAKRLPIDRFIYSTNGKAITDKAFDRRRSIFFADEKDCYDNNKLQNI